MKIEKIWITDTAVWIRTDDGREACEQLADYPRLAHATAEQLQHYDADSYGIHWPELDEDLCFDGFFRKAPATELFRLFMSHPELNVSAMARRMGISQSLMAQYISGKKTPSEKRMAMIYDTIGTIGRELVSISNQRFS